MCQKKYSPIDTPDWVNVENNQHEETDNSLSNSPPSPSSSSSLSFVDIQDEEHYTPSEEFPELQKIDLTTYEEKKIENSNDENFKIESRVEMDEYVKPSIQKSQTLETSGIFMKPLDTQLELSSTSISGCSLTNQTQPWLFSGSHNSDFLWKKKIEENRNVPLLFEPDLGNALVQELDDFVCNLFLNDLYNNKALRSYDSQNSSNSDILQDQQSRIQQDKHHNPSIDQDSQKCFFLCIPLDYIF